VSTGPISGRPQAIPAHASTASSTRQRVTLPSIGTGRSSPTTPLAAQAVSDVKSSTPFPEVKRVPFINASVLEEKLQVGDIIMWYCPTNVAPKIAMLRGGQTVAKLYTQKSTDVSENFIHVSMYVGNGQIAEATGVGVIQSPLSGERYKLPTDSHEGFLIIRPTNPLMAQEAARIAEKVTARGGPHQYSVAKALFSIATSSELTDESLKRFLKGAAFAINDIQPVDRNGIRDFFCSYFVAWACQASEAKNVIEKINENLPDNQKITIPDVKEKSPEEAGVTLENWAKQTAAQHRNALKENISLTLDPKYTTPQRFYGFVLDHPELLTKEMYITAPKSEMEMTEFSKKSR